MPNTPIRRLENSCMPPKKSTWRFDNPKYFEHPSSETQFVEPEKLNSYGMLLMSDNNEMKPVHKVPVYSMMESLPHIKDEQSEDAPLDFSRKTGSNSNHKTEPVNHLIQPLKNCELKEGGNGVNYHPRQVCFASKMFNGNNSPPSPPNRNPALIDTSHATSSCKDSDSVDMDFSQESDKSPLRSPSSRLRRINKEIHQDISPEHPHFSRENSPTSQTSILEGMLRNQQQSNIGIPNRPPAFGTGYGNGLSYFENQIISSPSPPMPIGTPMMHPANILSLPMAQYFGYGFVEQANPFMQGYMYKPPESNIGDISAARKSKKKVFDPLTDSLKGCSVDELRKKLDSIKSDNSLGINPDYAVNLKTSYTPHVDHSRRFSNNPSPQPVKDTVNNSVNNCTVGIKKENHEVHNDVVGHQNNSKSNIAINHNKENNTAIADINPNENNRSTANHNETIGTNNVENVSSPEDTNDSLPSAKAESPDDRKRKPFPDYKNDPMYKIKRAKNNLAARRSRESRRMKEEIIRKTADILEQQNKVILRDFTALKYSYDESQVKYFALMKEYENVKIQNSVLAERLNQKRCGQCGSALPNVG